MAAGSPTRTWYHTIDLPDGGHTHGWYDTRSLPDLLRWPAALEGGRCLDVGTFDGFWAFEMERRGAREVVALDLDDPERLDWFYDERQRGPEVIREWGSQRGPGFAEAAKLVGSKVQRVNCSVYDIDPDVLGSFDVVFCGALLLHLAEPVRALEAIRGVCRGQLLLVEHLDAHLDLVSRRRPAASFASDWDQWWRINSAGLVSLVQHAGFDVDWLSPRLLMPYGPAAPRYSWRTTARDAIAARRPTKRGLLYRALLAKPRSPRPSR